MGVLIRRASMFQLLLLYCCFTAFSQSGTLAQGSMSGMAMQMMEMMLHPLMEEYSLSYSPHELEVAKAAYLNATANPCSAKGRATKECCPMCNYCDKCEASKCATRCAPTSASTAPSARKTVSNLDIAAKCAMRLAFLRLDHASDVDANERQLFRLMGG